MITCKEDLMNTFIINDKSTLREVYLSKLEGFGFEWYTRTKVPSQSHLDAFEILVNTDGKIDWNRGVNHGMSTRKELTLSDFKPFLQTASNYEHTKTLNFIRDRLVEVHGEPKNLDYMHKLNNAIMFVESVEGAKVAMGGNESMCMTVDIESKPKRTKVELVKVELSPKEIFSEMLDGGVFSVNGDKIYFDGEQFWRGEGDDKSRITYISHVNEIYKEVETEITVYDFIEGALKKGIEHPCDEAWFSLEGEVLIIDGKITIKGMREITDNLDDNGKFKS